MLDPYTWWLPLVAVSLLQTGEWQSREILIGPSPRLVHAMAYDPVGDQVLLFGGRHTNAGLAGDTWLWDGRRWHNPVVAGPEKREGHTLALCPKTGHLVLFGGRGSTSLFGDTWRWHAGTWQRTTMKGPLPRWGHAMASYQHGLLLFGGIGKQGFLRDTWLWDGQSWTLQSSSGPAPRYGAKLVAFDQDLLLFGGRDHAGHWYRDTWRWRQGMWHHLPPGKDEQPEMSVNHHLVLVKEHLLLMGGSLKSKSFFDIWIWRGEGWERCSQSLPFHLDFGAMVYVPSRDTLVAAGQSSQQPSWVTWTRQNPLELCSP